MSSVSDNHLCRIIVAADAYKDLTSGKVNDVVLPGMQQSLVDPVPSRPHNFVRIAGSPQFVGIHLRLQVEKPLHILGEGHFSTTLGIDVDDIVTHCHAVRKLFPKIVLHGLDPLAFRDTSQNVLFHFHIEGVVLVALDRKTY